MSFYVRCLIQFHLQYIINQKAHGLEIPTSIINDEKKMNIHTHTHTHIHIMEGKEKEANFITFPWIRMSCHSHEKGSQLNINITSRQVFFYFCSGYVINNVFSGPPQWSVFKTSPSNVVHLIPVRELRSHMSLDQKQKT